MPARINHLHWLTFLKVAIGPNVLFPVLAHQVDRSYSATTACGRSAGMMTPRDHSASRRFAAAVAAKGEGRHALAT
jgi:hypothetical protein